MFYDASRKLILKGVDGVVFVADSQEMRRDANIESVREPEDQPARATATSSPTLPYVLQLNKRDLPGGAAGRATRRGPAGQGRARVFEAVATKGVGVFDTLKTIIRLVLNDLRRR